MSTENNIQDEEINIDNASEVYKEISQIEGIADRVIDLSDRVDR